MFAWNRKVGLAAVCAVTAGCLSVIVAGSSSLSYAADASASARSRSASSGPKANDYGMAQVGYINEMIRQGWADRELTPSGPALDAEWCRRVYLDILGRVPSVDELTKFMRSPGATRKKELVDLLLSDDPKYLEEYARNWTTIWTNILIGRTGGTEDDTLINRDGMQQYLRRSFLRNKHYDVMVKELVAATGNTKPGSENFNGAANFLVGGLEENGVLATAKTAQIFLGLQVQCTQCHNHPFNDWKQNQFWEMNAFFRQTRALRQYAAGTRDMESVNLANQDFAGEAMSKDAKDGIIFYELRNSQLKSAYPVFVDGTSLAGLYPDKGNSGYLSDVNRREELANMIVGSEYTSKAIVNRMWGHFLGYGFTKPVDDMGPHNPPTHPELLERLAKDFRSTSFDLKQLIRWITLSEPYSLSSRFGPRNKMDDPSLGEKPAFSHFYVRQMRPEELYESLMVATAAGSNRGSYEEQERAKSQWLRDITVAFGTDEGDETTTFNGTITQALMMFNGDLIKEATSAEQGNFLYALAANSEMNAAEKVHYLYQAALARKATRDELAIAGQVVAARKGDIKAALEDVWWVLLNSSEFILNH